MKNEGFTLIELPEKTNIIKVNTSTSPSKRQIT